MFIKSDKQVAYDKINHLLRLTSDQYRDAAERMEDEQLAAWFQELAEKREQFSEELEEEIRRSGELPTRPDPDNEIIKNLLVGLRETFSSDHVKFELQQRDALETELVQSLEEVKHYPLSPEMLQIVQQLEQQVHSVRNQIRARMDSEPA